MGYVLSIALWGLITLSNTHLDNIFQELTSFFIVDIKYLNSFYEIDIGGDGL